MDIARVFETLSHDMLREFVAEQRQEDLYLDFKNVNADLTADDRRNLARALSGFANSSGGIIVWGVDARKNKEGIDCASALREIEKVAALLTRLNQLTGEGVDPIVDGVRHRIIPTADGRGFAVTLVPESGGGPHMAKLREDRYFKRSGDSFYQMEHFDIADMFGRRRRPTLEVTASVKRANIIIGIRNDGRASARAPYLAINCDGPFQRSMFGLDGNYTEGLPLLRGHEQPWRYGGGGEIVIHPGMQHDVALLWLGLNGERRPHLTNDTVIKYEVACEDQPVRQGEIVIPLAQIDPPAA